MKTDLRLVFRYPIVNVRRGNLIYNYKTHALNNLPLDLFGYPASLDIEASIQLVLEITHNLVGTHICRIISE